LPTLILVHSTQADFSRTQFIDWNQKFTKCPDNREIWEEVHIDRLLAEQGSKTPDSSSLSDVWAAYVGGRLPAADAPDKPTPPAGEIKSTPEEAQGDERKIGDYPTTKYAEGYPVFVGREMEPGPLADLIGEFGKELTLGQFEPAKLAEMMKSVEPMDQKALAEATRSLNAAFARENLELNIALGADGKISSLQLRETFKPENWRVGLRVDSSGAVSTSNVRVSLDILNGPLENKPISANQASFLLAKKSSALSCP
jgi:hypothetical protein